MTQEAEAARSAVAEEAESSAGHLEGLVSIAREQVAAAWAPPPEQAPPMQAPPPTERNALPVAVTPPPQPQGRSMSQTPVQRDLPQPSPRPRRSRPTGTQSGPIRQHQLSTARQLWVVHPPTVPPSTRPPPVPREAALPPEAAVDSHKERGKAPESRQTGQRKLWDPRPQILRRGPASAAARSSS